MNCFDNFEPLELRFKEIVKQYSAISHLIETKTKRSAWFAGIGSIMKYLFGTLDENDAIVFDKAIDSVLNNEKKLSSLVKENILVTNSVINKFNETLLTIQQNEYKLNEAFDKFSLILSNITNTMERFHLQNIIDNVFNSLEMSIITLSFQLEDIINAIMFSSINKLHPSVITPNQLHKELIDSFRHLPQDLELPTPLEIDMIHIIMDISKVSSYYSKGRLTFILQIPLVSTKEFNLYHNIPLPIPHSLSNPNTFSLIIPSAKYIAVTIDKSHYFDLESLNNCLIINYKYYVCNVANVYTTDTKITCESELLSKIIREIPSQCETKFIYGKVDIWKKLKDNKWIFVQTEPVKITIECLKSESNEENSIVGTGIINLPESCIGYSKNTVLKSKISKNLPLPTVAFDYNLINDSCCNTLKAEMIKNSVSPIELERIDLDNLKPLKDKLNKKLLNTKLEEEIPHIVKYGTHYSIITNIILIAIICAILYFVILRLRYFVKKSKLTENKSEVNIDLSEIETTNEQTDKYPNLKRNV